MQARARVPGLAADLAGLQLRLLVLHRPVDPRPRGRAATRSSWSPRSSALAADGVREVTLLGQNVNSYGRDLPRERADRASPSCSRRVDAVDGHRADPLHEPAPEGHARGRDPRPRRARRRLRAHPPAAAVGLEPGPEGDAPHLRPRALPRPGGADPRARARLRAHDRHHRRLPGRDRGGLRRDARGRRRRSATTAPSRSSSRPRRGTEAATLGDQVPHPVKRERMERLVEARPAPRAASARSASSGARWRSWSRARAAPTRRRLRGRTRHNKTVNFDGTAARGRAGRGRDRRRPPRRRCPATSACSAAPLARPRCGSLAIFGPTAVGKTGVAIEVAELLRERGEDPVAVSCDSIQVYRGLEVLSGAATAERARAARAPAARSRRGRGGVLAPGRFAELAHAEIDALLAEGGARSSSAAPASTCAPRWPSSTCARRSPPRSAPRSRRELAERGAGGAARRARARDRVRRPPERPQADRAPDRAGAARDRPARERRGAVDRAPAPSDACWSG